MKVMFERKIGKQIRDPRQLRAKYGRLAESIETVVSILEVGSNLEEVPNVPPTRRHKLSGNYRGCWALDLDKSHRLILEAPSDAESAKDVEEVTILEVVDYH